MKLNSNTTHPPRMDIYKSHSQDINGVEVTTHHHHPTKSIRSQCPTYSQRTAYPSPLTGGDRNPLVDKLESFTFIEVANGENSIVQLTITEVMAQYRLFCATNINKGVSRSNQLAGSSSSIGMLTMRDLTQILQRPTNPRNALLPAVPLSSVEIRLNCVLINLPPVTAIVFYDRVLLHVNESVDVDVVVQRLMRITSNFTGFATATHSFWTSMDTQKLMAARLGVAETGSDSDSSDYDDILPTGESSFDLTEEEANVNDAVRGKRGPRSLTDKVMMFRDIPEANFHSQVSATPVEYNPYTSFPLECAIIECLLTYCLEELVAEVNGVEAAVNNVYVANDIRNQKPKEELLYLIFTVKVPLRRVATRTADLKDTLAKIIQDDSDMNHIELTRLYFYPEFYFGVGSAAKGWGIGCFIESEFDGHIPTTHEISNTARGFMSHSSVVNDNLEIMLEYFAQEVDIQLERIRVCDALIEDIQTQLDFKLNMKRAKFHVYEVALAVGSLFSTTAGAVTGAFGMNLLSRAEEHESAFYWVCGVVMMMILIGITLAGALTKAHSV